MDYMKDGEQSSESTQYQSEAYVDGQESESYPRLLSNQASDVLDVLDESGSEAQYSEGQQQYGQDYYGQSDSGSVA